METLSNDDFARRRERLVRRLERQGIRNAAVLAAMGAVPREVFLPPGLHDLAYEDRPLPIGHNQTISQPYIVALMSDLLEVQPRDRVLEIGTGSGYAAAVLAKIAEEVYTVERYRQLAERACRRLARQGFSNVHVLHGDGTHGWPEHAPYDAITAAASGPDVPKPLVDQMNTGGRLVMPVGQRNFTQKLVRVRKVNEHDYRQEELADVKFVPLVGAAGWDEP